MSRLNYWQNKAKEAKADFDRLILEQANSDEQLSALMEYIHANRELDRESEGERFSWIFKA